MKFDYMGYGDIYGGIFDNSIYGRYRLSFDIFFDGDVKSLLKDLNLISGENQDKKQISLESKNINKELCLSC